jgi:hypothetical protein
VTLALIALVTLAGPWGAYAVSMRSQQHRLEALLARHGIWRDGRIAKASGTVPWQDQRELSRTLDYLVQFHGSAALARWFSGSPALSQTAAATDSRSLAQRLMAEVGLNYVGHYEPAKTMHFQSAIPNEALDIAGYQHMVQIDQAGGTRFRLDGKEYEARLLGPAAAFEVRRGSELVLSQALGPMIERLASGGTPASPAAMTLLWDEGPLRAKLVFRHLWAMRTPDNRIELTSASAVLLLARR